MRLKHADLKYIKMINGAKPHFVFQQDGQYFLLTEIDQKARRGNFIAIQLNELSRVKEQLTQNTISTPFHPDRIYKSIRSLDIKLDSNNPEYYIQRLRQICYVLTALGELRIEKQGREIWFSKQGSLLKVSQKAGISQSKSSPQSNLSARKQSKTESDKLIKILRTAFNTCTKQNGWVTFTAFGQALRKNHKGFVYSDYGYKNLTAMVKANPTIIEHKQVNNENVLRMK